MQILQKIWEDIRRGENVDLYLTVVASFGLVILNLMGITPQTWIAPLTLAVLGLLAISTLGNRYSTEELLQKLTLSTDTVFLDEFPSSINNDFETATELWLIGVSLNRTVRNYYSALEQKLHKGYTIRVLLVHPEGAASEIAGGRDYGRTDAERTRRQIRDTLQYLCDLGRIAPHSLKIRTIRDPLSYGVIAINPETTSGAFYIEHFPFKTVGGSIPKFVLRAKDGRWYDFFRAEIRTLWDNGIEWKCDEMS